jgi:hypothetical protein
MDLEGLQHIKKFYGTKEVSRTELTLMENKAGYKGDFATFQNSQIFIII